MMRSRAMIGLLISGMLVASAAYGQSRRDPLTPLEITKLRDQAQDPDLRLKLYVEFARQRLDAIDKVRSDPKITDRGTAIHDGLQDFLDVYDEMNDNVDTFDDQKADFRKGLKLIIEADVEFAAKLRALQNSLNPNKDDEKVYEFLLQSAVETVDDSVKDHRQLLEQQEEAAKQKKKLKHR
ncbi:MAG: hypothetical protein ACRD2S_06925 [Terriglobales bacterium]